MNTLTFFHPLKYWSIKINLESPDLVDDLHHIFGLFQHVAAAESQNCLINITIIKSSTCYVVLQQDVAVFRGSKEAVLGYVAHIFYTPLFLQNNAITYLHGACMIHPITSRSIIFLGPRETGKTTLLSFLLSHSNYQYLSDDIVPIDNCTLSTHSFPSTIYVRDDDVVNCVINRSTKICPTSTKLAINGETKTVYTVSNYAEITESSLGAIYLLDRNNSHRNVTITRLSLTESLYAIVHNLHDPNHIHHAIPTIIRLVESVPVFRLCYGSNMDDLNTILDYFGGTNAN